LKDNSDETWKHWDDLPEEKENALIEKIAKSSIDRNLGTIAQILLGSFGPLPSFAANLGMGIFGPYLELLGVDTYTALFRNRDNLQRIIDRIDELTDEKKEN
jgi:hypothetical protein